LWDGCSAPFDEGDLLGRECFGGLDIANTSDLAALALAFPWGMEKGEPVYRMKWWFWIPADTDEPTGEKLRRKLFPWVQAGFVEQTDGNTIDLGRIETVTGEVADRYNLRGICYDPWNAGATAQALEAKGIKVEKFVQNATNFNEPSKAFERAVAARRLLHNGNPVMRWMASNCVARTNGAGYLMPDRKRSRDKIDGVPAGVMAIAGEMRARFADNGVSVYETRGVD
jgi:phage terminase large subunit-like protein